MWSILTARCLLKWGYLVMKKYKICNFIETTKAEFQKYQSEPISDTQALDIQNNLFGVIELLIKWTNDDIKYT